MIIRTIYRVTLFREWSYHGFAHVSPIILALLVCPIENSAFASDFIYLHCYILADDLLASYVMILSVFIFKLLLLPALILGGLIAFSRRF